VSWRDPKLLVLPDRVAPGERFVLRFDAPTASRVVSGPQSFLCHRKDGWELVYVLHCKWGGQEPWCQPIDEARASSFLHEAVGILGDVELATPQVEDGTYALLRPASFRVPRALGAVRHIWTAANLEVRAR
jgi:hypothetical protein